MGDRQKLPLEQALLGFLVQGPAHGYELHQHVQDELGLVWHMGISNIYGALKRLEKEGAVASTASPQEGRPPRKVYHITPQGREQFRTWVREPVPAVRDMRVEFLAKLYFIHRLALEEAEDVIDAQEATCRERLDWIEQSTDQHGADAFTRLVFDFRLRQTTSALEWLKACREACRQWRH